MFDAEFFINLSVEEQITGIDADELQFMLFGEKIGSSLTKPFDCGRSFNKFNAETMSSKVSGPRYYSYSLIYWKAFTIALITI